MSARGFGRGGSHRPFAIVFGGGGARGFAHLGVLRALEREGYRPRLVVGVSMGAVVGVTYASRPDWYEAVLDMELADFPGLGAGPPGEGRFRPIRLARTTTRNLRTLMAMVMDWGPGTPARGSGLAEVRKLVGHGPLNETRVPVVVTATDLVSGERVVLRSAPADDAVYASGALAGVLPPLPMGDCLLADGAYTDLAPVDVARELESAAVLAVDVGSVGRVTKISNGYQAIIRAMEICHRQHAHLRFNDADLVLRPRFSRDIETLEFSARRECVAAGIRVVRTEWPRITRLLGEPGAERFS